MRTRIVPAGIRRLGWFMGIPLLAALAFAPASARAQAGGPGGARPAPASHPVAIPADTQPLRGLPLREIPARRPGGRTLVFLMTGDGNWTAAMSALASTLADSGHAVVGLEARTYMSIPHTPAGNAADAERILRYYLRRWDRDSIVVAGYSRGADWAPIIVARLPADLRERVRLVVLLGPDRAASYEFSWSDLVRENPRPTDVPLARIVASLRGLPLLCLYGRDEAERSLCPTLPSGLARVILREGGHVATDGALLAREVLAAMAGGTPGGRSPDGHGSPR